MRGLARFGLGLALAVTTASAGMTTTVTLRSQEESIPKLGLPSVRVEVQGMAPVALDTFRDWMAVDVLRLSHVREGAGDPSPDYTLVVRFLEPDPDSVEVRFEAALLTHEGGVAWIADGRSAQDGPSGDAAVWRSVGRNVISALFRDGWLQPKYDPDDPPPAAPNVERKAAAPR